ncbi:hypothetical protein F443_15516 [Phytophthora nicotianae P1569]|uniref:MULE transposase domain-containing protein n=1 Tax=Phytophthora nicotianae P1569 TaxID=1317065 RepID=V9EL98_PHYNI|nr:hypothetical protein F443_15516 [Phytophthora nicotianae P1569]
MDADAAQRSAIESIAVQCLDVESQPKYMMCFFHVMKNVKKRITYLSESKNRIVFRHIYRIHYAWDGVEKKQCIKEAIADWNKDRDLKEFGYFLKQWLTGRFNLWQCVESPMGMAKTNNPIENFNGQFKQQHTQRRLLRLNTLFEKLLECCSLKSILSITFETTTRASVETLRAYRK